MFQSEYDLKLSKNPICFAWPRYSSLIRYFINADTTPAVEMRHVTPINQTKITIPNDPIQGTRATLRKPEIASTNP